MRTDRAGQLLTTLRRQFQRWTDAQTANIGAAKQVGPTEFEISMEGEPQIQHLYRAAVTVGEIAYNCRAALDDLVRELATHSNGGREVRGTQFPIEDDEAMFDARVTGKHPTSADKKVGRYLYKVPPDAIAYFRQLQPFAGCEWTALLRDGSNPDKHRTLPFLTSQESFRHAVFDPADGMVTGQRVASIRRPASCLIGYHRPPALRAPAELPQTHSLPG